ncbi:hypothetical protein QTO34_012271 [Cnephaeus nilssonii]|uniref:Bicaudal D-related protein 1 n=1 Tax=Cnephaeus nilssonii TaxID=3371016 RepID=A0AA40LCX4_CNENI|nr:hypothetical protein QTO34_012271 [Eptesicus nilssonii]
MGNILKEGKWVPHQLNERQMENRKVISKMLLQRHERKSFLHRIVTGDEKWIYFENPKRTKSWVDPDDWAYRRFSWVKKSSYTPENMHYDKVNLLPHTLQEFSELYRRLREETGWWKENRSGLLLGVRFLSDKDRERKVGEREASTERETSMGRLTLQNKWLGSPLLAGSEVERRLSLQVHALREDFREKNSSTNQHILRLESLQAEIKMLSDRKRELEHRLSATLQENDLLQGTVEELQDRVLILERQGHDKDLQLHQSQLELQEVRLSCRQLQGKVEELTEERSLQSSAATSTSLLSEIEQSMEAEELEQEREQVLLPTRHSGTWVPGGPWAGPDFGTPPSPCCPVPLPQREPVRVAGPAGQSLVEMLVHYELKRLIQSIVDGVEPTSSRRIEDDSLEEQIRQTSEDSRALRELMEGERGKLRQSLEELQRLHSQVTLLSVEMTALKEERDRLRVTSEDKEPKEQLQKAVRDRDEAIAKKNAVELELAKCKMDMMSLNSQLLDAIQQKLNLSQQLEAWQDDMHRVIDRQLMDTHLKERSRPAVALSRARGPGRGVEPSTAEGKRLFSFFRKI